jgi:hypothetical protein
MSKYITRTAYFLQLAQRDPNIKHGVSETVEGETYQRNSFVEVASDQDSLNADMINGLHFPFVVQKGFSGSLTDGGGDIRNQYQNTLQFLTKAIPTDAVPTKEAAIKNAKEQMLIILKKWLNKFYAEVEQGCTGDFKKIDFATVRFFDVGPISDEFYGWELSFADDEPAHDVIDTDPDYFD